MLNSSVRWLTCFLVLGSLAACERPADHAAPLDPSPYERPDDRADSTVIYGKDTRREVFEEKKPQIRRLAHSTLMLVQKHVLKDVGDQYLPDVRTYQELFRLCPSERFAKQLSPGDCTGFLVAPDTVVTAGHCITQTSECGSTVFAFGYSFESKASLSQPLTIAKSDVYECQSVIHSKVDDAAADFAVVRLARPVLDREPLKLRREGRISKSDGLLVAGHPSGLPMKISDRAKVRKNSHPAYFVANLDVYAGNSGSPVFNSRTLVVEGILVRGEEDFVETANQCRVSKICPYTGCRGEDVTRISEVLPYLQ